MTEIDVQEQTKQIVRVDRQFSLDNIGVGGMAIYGEKFNVQRDYYRALLAEEKRAYEAAVIEICRMDDVDNAVLALYICSELANVFPDDWRNRVAGLVHSLIDQGLPLAYHGAISYAVIGLIRAFRMERFVPFVREFLQDLRVAYMEDKIPQGEFNTLIDGISSTLILVSPTDFWSEFALFNMNRDLMSRLENDIEELTYFWASYGMQFHGFDWLRQLTIECLKSPNETMTRGVYLAIMKHATYVESVTGVEPNVAELLERLTEGHEPHSE